MNKPFIFIWVLASLLLTGCGFHLRGQNVALAANHAVNVSSLRAHDMLAEQLIDTLNANAVKVVDEPLLEPNGVNIRILESNLERRLLSVYAGGQVAEYELIYSVNYLVSMGDQEPQLFNFDLLNDYQDDPDQPLAKSRELALIMDQLHIEAAQRILQTITSLTATN